MCLLLTTVGMIYLAARCIKFANDFYAAGGQITRLPDAECCLHGVVLRTPKLTEACRLTGGASPLFTIDPPTLLTMPLAWGLG